MYSYVTKVFHVYDVTLSYAVEVCWCWTSYNLIINKIILTPNFQYLVAWPLALITCLSRLGRNRYKFEIYTLEMEYQILVTARIRSSLELMVCCFRCSRILITLQMFSIILRSGNWDGQSRQSTSLLSFHNFVCTDWCTGALSSWKIHWLFSNFATTGQRLLSRMSMYLAELVNISFYICDCTNSVFTYTPTKHYKHTGAAITTSIQS